MRRDLLRGIPGLQAGEDVKCENHEAVERFATAIANAKEGTGVTFIVALPKIAPLAPPFWAARRVFGQDYE